MVQTFPAFPTGTPNTFGENLKTYLSTGSGSVEDRIESLETHAQYEVWVDDMPGADDDAKVAAAYAAIVAARRSITTPVASDAQGSAVMRFSGRDYFLTDDAVMMTDEAFTGMSWGIRYQGMGQYITRIVYTPSAEAYLCRNTDDWGGIRFEGIEFYGANANACFYRGDRQANGYAQQHLFMDCSWQGTWKYGFRISGIDNNDTWSWHSCHMSGVWTTWFWSDEDAVVANDQQVVFNYYHTNMLFTSCQYVFRYTKGGFLNVYGGAFIATHATNPTVWFKLEGSTHDSGATHLTVRGIRGELRTSVVKIIESEWGYGHVTFSDCDWAVSASAVGVWETATFLPSSCFITWERCMIQGQHAYEYDYNTPRNPEIVYRSCLFWDHDEPHDFVITRAVSGGGADGNRPIVRFRDCRGNDGTTPWTKVWNADINWQWNLFGATERKVLSFKDQFGNNPSQFGSGLATSLTRYLPLNAVIVEARIAWDGAIGTAGGNIRFQDGTPTTILNATGLNVAGATATAHGYRFKCDTDTKRAITLTTDAGVTSYQLGGLFEAWIEYIG